MPGPVETVREQLYEVISGYDSRIIKRGLTEAQASEWCRYLNRRTEHGAYKKVQNY